MVTSQPDVLPSQAQDFSHLHPNVRQAAMLSNEQRLVLIRADRWIGYPRATEAVDRLEELLTWPARQRIGNPRYRNLPNGGSRGCVAGCSSWVPVLYLFDSAGRSARLILVGVLTGGRVRRRRRLACRRRVRPMCRR